MQGFNVCKGASADSAIHEEDRYVVDAFWSQL